MRKKTTWRKFLFLNGIENERATSQKLEAAAGPFVDGFAADFTAAESCVALQNAVVLLREDAGKNQMAGAVNIRDDRFGIFVQNNR